MAEASDSSLFGRWRSALGLAAGAPAQPTSAHAQPAQQPAPAKAPEAAPPAEPQAPAPGTPRTDADAAKHRRCERFKGKLLSSSAMVKFMMKELDKSGCPFVPEHFKCLPCGPSYSGGFAPEYGIVLCEDQIIDKSHLGDTMVHELVHAYDFCTVKLNFNSCANHACTEIRAAMLSGECRFSRELLRGHPGFSKHFQECVRRRAILSLKQKPLCRDSAEEAVRGVWESCFADTAPFDEIV
ncbi:Mitochondrial inner membrane protease atp23 [Polyrhizophydium stewartii]|uniref:Mitochondrial inner membrane protease ATP23 n=1 Tax=Polyrhizophydium stewartii TaxID=2732419 RepID=A0ABR4NBN4_9FUNG